MQHPFERDPVSQVCLAVAVLCSVGLLTVGYELQAGLQRELGAVEEEARHLGRELDASTARRRAATLAEAKALERAISAARPAPAATGPRSVTVGYGYAADDASDKPSGSVIFSDPALGYVWIDRGRRHGVRLKSRFFVYRWVDGGNRYDLGVVEAVKVEADLSQCLIQNNDPSDPIRKGDLLQVPPAR